jgi:uncharacterized protein YjbI with pentapeptide repeats
VKKIKLNILIIIILVNYIFAYNPEHFKILKTQNPTAYWNKWRKDNPKIKPNISNAKIANVAFLGDFSNVNMKNTKISDSSFLGVDFTSSDLSNCIIKKIDTIIPYGSRAKNIFNNAKLYKINILDVEIDALHFNNVDFRKSHISNSKIIGIYKNVKLMNAKINNSTLGYDFYTVDISNSDINRSVFSCSTKMEKVKFNNSKIIECIFIGVLINIDFKNTDMTASRLTYSELLKIDFTNANLTNVNFQKAVFKNVIFKNADMKGAKIERKWYNYIKNQGVRNFDKIKWE